MQDLVADSGNKPTLVSMLCRQIPYAFWHLPLKGIPDGFPVLLDINLSQVSHLG